MLTLVERFAGEAGGAQLRGGGLAAARGRLFGRGKSGERSVGAGAWREVAATARSVRFATSRSRFFGGRGPLAGVNDGFSSGPDTALA